MAEAIVDVLTTRPLVSESDIAAMFRALCRQPSLVPDFWGSTEPIRLPFDSSKVDELAHKTSMASLHGGGFYWRHKKPKSWGGLYADNGPIPSHASLTLDAYVGTTFETEEIISLLIDWSRTFEVDLGFIDIEPPEVNRRQTTLMMTTRLLHEGLRRVYWATVFGLPYIELFGRDRLASVPASVRVELSPNLFYFQLTDSFDDLIDHPERVNAAREAVKAHLGADAFFDPERPDRKVRVPMFNFPHNPHRPPMPVLTPKQIAGRARAQAIVDRIKAASGPPSGTRIEQPPANGIMSNPMMKSDGKWNEFSTNLDWTTLPEVLELVARLIPEGFGQPEVRQVIAMAKSMAVNDEKSLTFSIMADEKHWPFNVHIFMDDESSPDTYFFTTHPSLCSRIGSAIEKFFSGSEEV